MQRTATLLALAAALAFVAPAAAQDYSCNSDTPRRCTVQPGFGTLSAAITAEGNDNTIFVLQRGGQYILNGRVQNDGFALRLEAAPGTGKPPVVQPGAQNNGSSPNPTFAIGGNFSARGIYFLNISDIGSLVPRMFDIVRENVTFEITDSILDYTRFVFVQVVANGADVTFRNNLFRNAIWIGNDANGRIIDVRGVSANSVTIENNTLQFFSGGVFTTGGSNSRVTDFVLNHNTIYAMGNRPLYDGTNASYVNGRITNNIFVDVALIGAPTGSPDPFPGVVSISELADVPVSERNVVIDNNNIFYTQQAEDFFAAEAGREAPPFFSDRTTESVFDALRALPNARIEEPLMEDLVFDEALSNPAFFTYHTEFYTNGQTSNFTPFFFDQDSDPDGGGPLTPAAVVDVFPLAGDFGYSTSSASYTAGGGGCPLGDLRYFANDPNVNVQACLDASFNATDGEDGPGAARLAVRVLGNPVRGRLALRVDLEAASPLDVRLFDVLGRQVAASAGVVGVAGQTPVSLDVSALAPGVYVYRVQADGPGGVTAQSGRVVVVR